MRIIENHELEAALMSARLRFGTAAVARVFRVDNVADVPPQDRLALLQALEEITSARNDTF